MGVRNIEKERKIHEASSAPMGHVLTVQQGQMLSATYSDVWTALHYVSSSFIATPNRH